MCNNKLQAKDIFSDNLKSGGGNIEISARGEYCIRKLQDRGREALTSNWLAVEILDEGLGFKALFPISLFIEA